MSKQLFVAVGTVTIHPKYYQDETYSFARLVWAESADQVHALLEQDEEISTWVRESNSLRPTWRYDVGGTIGTPEQP